MKNLKLFFCFLICAAAHAQSDSNYDKALAEKLGADERGMKMYVLVILKTGSNKTTDTNELFRGHMDNIGRLVKEGKLIVAGPFGKNEQDYRGLFILDVRTVAEAQEIVETDPAVKAKIFDVDYFQWYGGAALSEYLPSQDKITLKHP